MRRKLLVEPEVVASPSWTPPSCTTSEPSNPLESRNDWIRSCLSLSRCIRFSFLVRARMPERNSPWTARYAPEPTNAMIEAKTTISTAIERPAKAIEMIKATAVTAGGRSFSNVAARKRYSTNATSPMSIKTKRFVSLSSICSVPVKGTVVRGSKAIIMKNAVRKPIIIVSNCPGRVSKRSRSLSVAPAARLRSDDFSKMAEETTKESAQNEDCPYVQESKRAKIPQKVINV